MQLRGIKTSHDLADLLEDTARVLRMLPAMQLVDVRKPSSADSTAHFQNDRVGQERRLPNVSALKEQLPALDRTAAETQLCSLTVDLIRQLASSLDVRIPSKATKPESIKLVLSQLFDAPAGQELIRTFHKRNDPASTTKPLLASSKVR